MIHAPLVSDPRRRFLARLLAGASMLGPLATLARARGEARGVREGREGPLDENGYLLAHPVSPPPGFVFRYLEFKETTMYGGRSLAIAAVPRDLPPGARAPLVILLAGGHHMMQRFDVGCWGWWSEYLLGEAMTTLRGAPPLTSRNFWDYALPAQVARYDAAVRAVPWRHAIIVTPWVVGRQWELEPHGGMILPFLRDLIDRARVELPVVPTREATGLGGMSAGGMWSLYCGAQLADRVSSVIAIQPYTVGLVSPLAAAVLARPRAQRLRILTSEDDHQRESTCELAYELRSAGVELELDEYRGLHRWEFAAGPGILDSLLHFDRWLRGEELDGSRPFTRHDGAREPLVGTAPAPRPRAEALPAFAPVAPAAPRLAQRRAWPVIAGSIATTAAAVAFARRIAGRRGDGSRG
jgi:hypothetical protein